MLPTPDTSHLTQKEFDSVYEPAEDTFLLLDALEQDAERLKQLDPVVCLEIGGGSGCVSAFLAGILGPRALVLATDINPQACKAMKTTAQTNTPAALFDTIQSDLCSSFLPRLVQSIDVLLFNPPYVLTEDEEMINSQNKASVVSTWAGGATGRGVTDRVLALLADVLSPRGLFYLVAVAENQPNNIIQEMALGGFDGQIVLQRRAGRENLSIIRFARS